MDTEESEDGELNSTNEELDMSIQSEKSEDDHQGGQERSPKKMSANNKNEFNREEIIDAAVAKFQDVFMKSGLMETANFLKQQMEDQKKQTRLKGEKSDAGA